MSGFGFGSSSSGSFASDKPFGEASSTSLFGTSSSYAMNTPAAASVFGNQPPSAFDTSATTPSSSSGFGASSLLFGGTSASTSGFGVFGSTNAANTGGFGAQDMSSSLFAQSTNTSVFGSSAAPTHGFAVAPTAAPTLHTLAASNGDSAFGSTGINVASFGNSSAATSAFGTANAAPNTPGFNNSSAPITSFLTTTPLSGFGGSAIANIPSTTSGDIFGARPTEAPTSTFFGTPAAASVSGGFNLTPTSTEATTTSAFGNPSPSTAATTNLFGSAGAAISGVSFLTAAAQLATTADSKPTGGSFGAQAQSGASNTAMIMFATTATTIPSSSSEPAAVPSFFATTSTSQPTTISPFDVQSVTKEDRPTAGFTVPALGAAITVTSPPTDAVRTTAPITGFSFLTTPASSATISASPTVGIEAGKFASGLSTAAPESASAIEFPLNTSSSATGDTASTLGFPLFGAKSAPAADATPASTHDEHDSALKNKTASAHIIPGSTKPPSPFALGAAAAKASTGGWSASASTAASSAAATSSAAGAASSAAAVPSLALASQWSSGTQSTLVAVAQPGQPLSVLSDINDLNLDEVVNKWTDEVRQLTDEFQKGASNVSKWDRAIVSNEDKIVSLHKDAQSLQIAHKEMSNNLDVILSQQSELHTLLDALENDVEKKIGTVSSHMNGRSGFDSAKGYGDIEREGMHRASIEVMEELDSMAVSIRDLVLELNKSRSGMGLGGSGDTVSQIISVLNAHLDSLQYLDENSSALQKRLTEVTRNCKVASRGSEEMLTRHAGSLY